MPAESPLPEPATECLELGRFVARSARFFRMERMEDKR